MKLLGISMMSLLMAALVWGALVLFSQSQTYEAYDHPLIHQLNTPVLALEPETFEAATEFVQRHTNGGLLLKLHMSRDGHFFTADEESLTNLFASLKNDPGQFLGPKTFLYDYSTLKKYSEDIIPVEAWLQIKTGFWIFDLLSNAMDVDKYFVQRMKNENLDQNMIVRSDTDLIVSILKEKQPLWIYGSSQSDMMLMLTMSSALLEGMPRFNRDVYFSPLKFNNRDVLDERVIREIRKRKKKLAIGPVHTDLDREKALTYQPDILIVSEDYLKEFVLQ